MAVYYNFNNVKILVNNQLILADTLGFSLNTSLSEVNLSNKEGGFDYIADNGLSTDVTLTYFLVGADPLRPFVLGESFVPITAGGLTLQKGYVQSYSITAASHGLVKISANIKFYEDFSGSFTPETIPNEARDYLQFSDMDLSFAGINATSKILSLNYSRNCEMDPVYRAGDLVPSEIRYTKKNTSLNLDTYNFQEALTYVGKNVSVDFTLGPESFSINGTLTTKDVGIGFGEKITSALNIQSTSYGKASALRESNTGAQKNAGDYWNIYGHNLLDTTAIYFNNNIRANEFTTHATSDNGNDSYIKIKIPRFARSGPIKVFTPYGEAAHQQRSGGATIVANINPTDIP